MKPVEIVRVLEKCDLVHEWTRDQTLKRWHWAVESYCDGYIEHDQLDEERALFETNAEKIIERQSFLAYLRWAEKERSRPRTEAEQARRLEWLEKEAQLATQTELRRQRSRLREGHQTLSAIRRVLQGRDPLHRPGSAAAMTSPT